MTSTLQTGIEQFTIAIADHVLADLHDRLAATRWPDGPAGSAWDYGADLGYMRELARYWREDFDWREQERRLNLLPHYRVELDGLGIHFLHARGRGPDPLPIVLTHGWPSSFTEMLKVVPLLVDPEAHGGEAADAFDVVVPSLPGYGFSDGAPEPGFVGRDIAGLWAKLMDRLGYDRFAAHGGDIGAGVTTRLGHEHRRRVVGIHLTAVADPYLGEGTSPLTPAEQAYLDGLAAWEAEEGAYGHLQATKPQTLAYGLSDSPVALAAWIVEKFRTWSDCGGDVETRFTKDELLTNVTIYWATETINPSIRLYYEHRHHPWAFGPCERVEVPTGVTLFPNEFVRESHPPREWAERLYDVRHFRRVETGGHFPALEEPELLANELREFFRPLRHTR